MDREKWQGLRRMAKIVRRGMDREELQGLRGIAKTVRNGKDLQGCQGPYTRYHIPYS